MSITVKVTLDSQQVDELLRRADIFYDWFEPKFLQGAARDIAQRIREKAPVRTGFLRRSVTIRYMPGGYVEVGPTAVYAPFVEYGVSPHIIRPKFRKALRFEKGGKVIFTKLVHHPGFPGRFFVRSAYEEFLENAESLARQLLGWYWRVGKA